jgi:hypothetical protein
LLRGVKAKRRKTKRCKIKYVVYFTNRNFKLWGEEAGQIEGKRYEFVSVSTQNNRAGQKFAPV